MGCICQLTTLVSGTYHVLETKQKTRFRWAKLMMPPDGIRFTGDSTNGKTTTENHV
jgi:hypothetical protein